jgi:hypothetical protein
MGTAMSIESNGPSVPRDEPPATPHILELRIHGVRDTPPWDILGVPHGDAVMVSGDDLGSFWIPKTPSKDAGLPPQFGSEVPANVRREAYSWGAMARYAPVPGANLLGKGAAVIRRVGWLMMLPFALCNAAYWMRPLTRKPKPGDGDAGLAGGRGWRDANGGGIVRVFGLFLTLLLVASATAASVDLIGTQCVRSGEICSTLPGLFNGLTALDQPRRNVVLAILPLAMLAVIYALSVLGRVRYAANVAAHPESASLPAGPTTSADSASPGRPILQTKGFWYSPMMPRATELLHLSGAGALVVAMLAWDALYSPVPGCRDASTFFAPACGAGLSKVLVDGRNPARTVSAIAAGRGSFIVLLVAVAILIAVTCRILVSVTGNADVAGSGKPTGRTAGPVWRRELRWAASLLGLVVALGLVNAGLLWFPPESSAVASASAQQGSHFLGVFWTPGLLTLAMLGMSITGLGWRRGAGTAASLVLFAGSAACFIAGCLVMKMTPHRPGPAGLPAGLFVVAALLLACLAWRVLRKGDEGSRNREGWRGMGPGIIITISLGVALALSSVLVVGTANFLNGKLSLTGGTADPVVWRIVTDGSAAANGAAPMVTEVPVYDQYGLALFITVIVVVFILAWVLCSQLFGKLFVLSTPDPNSMPTEGVTAGRYPDGRPQPSVPPIGSVARRVLEGRRTAALLHRVEHSLSWLAGTFLVGLMGSLGWSLVQPSIAEDGAPTRSLLTQGMSSAVLGIVALALVGGIVVSAASSTFRPAGVLWDLMCFLPNAAHPFGPPCYAERVVPELCARIEEWLDFDDAPEPHRKVILSAHSLGGVLAVACLFARHADGKDLGNIGLLTYGCQLRAYFGRFFPELFGPTVLGTPGSLGASLWAPDPWQRQVAKDYDTTHPHQSHPQSLSQLLTTPGDSLPRWINLWRRTDFLGFPVKSYAGNEIDRGADELDTSSYMLTLATHSNYPSSRAYPSAMAELLKRMGEPEV